jgi:photosystem II stability/assembly factor-like uncharacterized protein
MSGPDHVAFAKAWAWLRTPVGLCSIAAVVGVVGAVAVPGRAVAKSAVRTAVGPTRLVSPGFGYSVAYRTVERRTTAHTTIGLFVYENGRWRNATPPMLRADGIDALDDVAFEDRRHGWVAAYNCARASVYLYRTSDGGRSWQALGMPAYHSCGGGPTFLSFVDDEHGWMEPVSPNGPVGELLGTSDGGQTWKRLASGSPGQTRPPALPCLAPIRFVSTSKGWMARCENGRLFSTGDGGRHWHRAQIRTPSAADARFDLPEFVGRVGVVAATLGTRPPTATGSTRAVAFAMSRDGGQHWSLRSTRTIASCPLTPYYTALWPASIVDTRLWWIVSGGSRPLVQVTADAGRRWRTVAAHGLPTRPCSVISVSAASRTVAWAVARNGTYSGALFQTRDGGRTWHRTVLLHG